MSHTMNINLELKDKDILLAVCEKLQGELSQGKQVESNGGRIRIQQVREGEHKLYSSTERGVGIYLSGWSYPIVVKEDGSIAYDSDDVRKHGTSIFNVIKAHYGLEKAKVEARRKGYSTYEMYNERTKELELHIVIT